MFIGGLAISPSYSCYVVQRVSLPNSTKLRGLFFKKKWAEYLEYTFLGYVTHAYPDMSDTALEEASKYGRQNTDH